MTRSLSCYHRLNNPVCEWHFLLGDKCHSTFIVFLERFFALRAAKAIVLGLKYFGMSCRARHRIGEQVRGARMQRLKTWMALCM
jgi:hypothetical protein